jgi:hypothetical protein
MDQRSLDYNNDKSHEIYLQLDQADRKSLIDLMALLIAAVFHSQEEKNHDQSHNPNKD